jgi:heptosyltransferase-2
MPEQVTQKILVVGPSWVGDMVMAQTLFKCLQQQHPQMQLDVLAPDWCLPLLRLMPEVNHALPLPLAHGELGLGKRRRIGRLLKADGYDQAIVLPNSLKSALIPWFAGIPVRTGWRGEARGWLLNDCRKLDKQQYPLMVQRFAALAFSAESSLPDPLPVPRLVPAMAEGASLRESLGLVSARPVLVLCPGAEFGPAKQWPGRHYATLAGHYLEKGMQVWLFGSEKDRADAEQIRSAVAPGLREHCHVLCGRTRLGEAVTLMNEATAVVSNDSGLMHIAAALEKPLVVVYGSTSPAFTPPLSARAKTLSLALPCSPCFRRECPLQHLDCLEKLLPQQVAKAIDDLLGSVWPGDSSRQ